MGSGFGLAKYFVSDRTRSATKFQSSPLILTLILVTRKKNLINPDDLNIVVFKIYPDFAEVHIHYTIEFGSGVFTDPYGKIISNLNGFR
jgi:hypothetical protein